MSNDLVLLEEVETQLKEFTPQFEDVLSGRMPPARLIRTVVISCQKTPKLLTCNRQSLMNAAMSFGVLGVEVDGFTGQGYILPFAGVAQPVIGYKGFNTIGARSRLTITGAVVRDGEPWRAQKGTKPFIEHEPRGNKDARIVRAWACATSNDRPPIVEWLELDELEDIRNRAPGAKKADSPWNDPKIGRPAMYEKSAKRRLARSTPMNWATPEFQYAAVMDEAFEERGKHSHIKPGFGVVIEGDAGSGSPFPKSDTGTPHAEDLLGRGDNPEIKALKEEGLMAAETDPEMVKRWWERLSPRQRADLERWKNDVLKPKLEQLAKGGDDVPH